MPAIHRNTDPRGCGASTIAVGQGTVFANQLLVSVNGDPNTHGGGSLIAACRQVFAGGILVVNHTPDTSTPDAFPHSVSPTAGGSPNVFVGD